MEKITPAEMALVSAILSRWSGCEIKVVSNGQEGDDPVRRVWGWISAKDADGLVNWIAFDDNGLVPHGETNTR